MSSINSTTSTPVNFRGDEEIDLEEALRLLYLDLQHNLNHSQCVIRTLSLCPERDESFLDAVNIKHELDDHIDVLIDLFTELQNVSKQCLGICPKKYKVEYKALVDARKEKKKKEKEDKKILIQHMKELEKLELKVISE